MVLTLFGVTVPMSSRVKKLTAGPLAISEAQRRREAKAKWVEGENLRPPFTGTACAKPRCRCPCPGCDRNAPWGHDESGLVIAPFGIGNNGLPRRRLPGNTNAMPSPVRTSITATLEEKLRGLDCDPIAILAEIAVDRTNEPRDPRQGGL